VAHGPIAAEAPSFAQHRPLRDIAAGLEKELARSLREAGYEVLNTVCCTVKPDLERFRSVCAAFATHFPQLAKMTE
jgi:hypothetical protein